MRIGVVTTWYPSSVSPGAGSFIARDSAALAQEHDVRVLHLVSPGLDDGEREFADDAGVRVQRVRLDVRSPAGWLRSRAVAGRFLQDRQVLHTMAAPALLPWIVRRPHLPWVHTEHWSGIAHIAGRGRARLARPLGRRAFAGPDAVVAVSGFLAGAVATMRRGRIEVIGNIVAAGLPIGDRAPANGAGDGSGDLALIAVGTITENKGWRLFLDAVHRLRAGGRAVTGTWVGTGPDRELMLAQVQQLGLTEYVRVTGQVPLEQVRAHLGAADLFVLPTRLETFSLATVEALGAGIPVVVTGAGGHTEMVTPESGRVVARDAGAIVHGIEEVLRECTPAGAAQRGAQLAEQFSPQRFVENYSRLYQEVCHG